LLSPTPLSSASRCSTFMGVVLAPLFRNQVRRGRKREH